MIINGCVPAKEPPKNNCGMVGVGSENANDDEVSSDLMLYPILLVGRGQLASVLMHRWASLIGSAATSNHVGTSGTTPF
jgi:hypothetical protein